MRALVSIHRWLGVVFCLFFAMWFVTGIAMHFVPFPALTEAERTAALGAIAPSSLVQASRAVADVYRLNEATRVRLFQRTDGPVFIAYGAGGNIAVHPDLSAARVQSPNLALAIAKDHA